MREEVVRGIAVEGAWDAGFDPQGLRRAFGLLERWIGQDVLPGAAALVARGGTIAGEAYLGLAHRAEKRPADSETIWGLASITKPVTATAVMLMVERGALALDEPLADLLPEFLDAPATPFDRRAVTLRHLLAHCSGLPGFSAGQLRPPPRARAAGGVRRAPSARSRSSSRPARSTTTATAASSWRRRSSGGRWPGTLRRAVASPAVGHYHPFVQQHILAPLGMTASSLRPPPEWDERIAWVERTGQEGRGLGDGEHRVLPQPRHPLGRPLQPPARPRPLRGLPSCPRRRGRQRIGHADPSCPARASSPRRPPAR